MRRHRKTPEEVIDKAEQTLNDRAHYARAQLEMTFERWRAQGHAADREAAEYWKREFYAALNARVALWDALAWSTHSPLV